MRPSNTLAGPGRARGVTILAGLGTLLALTPACLSNEYRITGDELRRLASEPPMRRGQRVHVVQQISTDDEAHAGVADDVAAQPDVMSDEVAVDDGSGSGNLNLNLKGGGDGNGSSSHPGGGHAPFHGGARAAAAPVRGSPTTPGGHAGGPSGGRGISFGGGGGGGGSGGDALVVAAVVLVGVAAIAAVVLAISEGRRFDGYVQVAPEQRLYFTDRAGLVRAVPLWRLPPDEVSGAREATIVDDERTPLQRLERAPLDRQGWAFKLDMGTTAFNHGTTSLSGVASHIQTGYFLRQDLGLMLDLGLGGAADCCLPNAGVIIRHSIGLELQALPLSWRRLHAGVYAKGGVAVTGPLGARVGGAIVDGGALVELDVIGRVAVAFRGGVDAIRADHAWSPAATFTGGLAIY